MRTSKSDLWNFWIGDKLFATRCLCCNKTIIIKTAKKGEFGEWVKGHIIHSRKKGPDIPENIRPICLQCNIDDKNYDSSYHYMIKLAILDSFVCKMRIDEIVRIGHERMCNPTRCKAIYVPKKKKGEEKSGPVNCKYNALPGHDFCGPHHPDKKGKTRNKIIGKYVVESIVCIVKTINALEEIDPEDPDIAILTEDLEKLLLFGFDAK